MTSRQLIVQSDNTPNARDSPSMPSDPHHTQPASHDLTEQLGVLWRTLRRGSSVEAFRQWLYTDADNTLEEASLRFLQTVAELGEARSTTIAERLSVNPSSVSRMATKLEALGLVERRRDPRDHRSTFLSLTEEGQAHLDRYVARAREALGDILSVFTRQEQMDLASQLTRFVESVDKYMEHRDR